MKTIKPTSCGKGGCNKNSVKSTGSVTRQNTNVGRATDMPATVAITCGKAGTRDARANRNH